MADYQEYRRRILHRRWRRMFITAALLILLVLLAAVGVLWKRLHREPAPNTAQGPTILQQELTGSEWNTISYTPARRLSVQTLDNGMTAMDFRLAAQPASPAVERSSFSDVSFLGDSLTQGMQLYDTGLPNAHFCAYKGVGPNAVVNNTTCRRADGEKEVPMEALASQQPRALYILLGTNVLTSDSDYTSFLTYYRLMLDMISQALPNTKIYVQSITPVRPEVSQKSPGLYKERLCEINDALSAIALEKGCTFLNLWEALADENQHMDGRVVVIGGGHAGAETANHIASYMKNVTIVELQEDIAMDEVDTPRNALLADLEKNKVRVCASTSVSEIKDHSVVVSGKFNEEIECDTVVISIGHTPNTALADELIQAGYDVRIIGDAVKVGLVGPAVRAGYLTARQI